MRIPITLAILISLFLVAGLCQSQDLEMRMFTIQHSNAQSISNVAQSLKSAEGSVTYDPNTNNLIVVDYPQNLQRIAAVIGKIDQVAKQVEVQVIVADVTDTLVRDIGLYSGQVILPHGDFIAVLRLLDTDKSSNIRSQMTIKTLSNQPAQLMVSKDEIIGQEITHYKDGTEVRTLIRKPIGDFLEVVPSVNGDGTITVIVRPTVSTLERRRTPYERSVLTQVIVNSGDTIAIGGMDSHQQTTENRSVSILGLPLGSKTKTESKKVVMFLTATIVD